MAAMHPLKQTGRVDDIAAASLFLLDDQSIWITGQVLGIDGGMGHVRV